MTLTNTVSYSTATEDSYLKKEYLVASYYALPASKKIQIQALIVFMILRVKFYYFEQVKVCGGLSYHVWIQSSIKGVFSEIRRLADIRPGEGNGLTYRYRFFQTRWII